MLMYDKMGNGSPIIIQFPSSNIYTGEMLSRKEFPLYDSAVHDPTVDM